MTMFNTDNNLNESDEEDVQPKAHKRLLNGLNSLQAGQFIRKATRNEPSSKRSEFHLVKPETLLDAVTSKKTKIDIQELVNVFDKTNKHLQLGKSLLKTSNKKKILPKPLERPAAEKLQRAINYEKTKEKLDRWDAVVTRNQATDHLVG